MLKIFCIHLSYDLQRRRTQAIAYNAYLIKGNWLEFVLNVTPRLEMTTLIRSILFQ